MTQYLEPCPMCGKEVPCNTNLDDGEDVRWAEWSCPCGLYYHAESRIVNERGIHDAEAELAELHAAWNTRAAATLEQFSSAARPDEWVPLAGGAFAREWWCECGQHFCTEIDGGDGEWSRVVELPNYCPNCGVKIEEVDA